MGHRRDQPLAEPIEEFAIRNASRSGRFAFLGVREDEIDVGRDVQLATAELAHRYDDEFLERSRFLSGRQSVNRGKRLRVYGHGGTQRALGQRGYCADDFDERRATGQVAPKPVEE
jgi:hypothetical protein